MPATLSRDFALLPYNPWTGLNIGRVTLQRAREASAPEWRYNPVNGKMRVAEDVERDPHMRGEMLWPEPTESALKPGNPTNPTLAQAQQMKRDLEADILALIQQFERNTGVRAVGLASEGAEVTGLESVQREWRTVAVRVSVVL